MGSHHHNHQSMRPPAHGSGQPDPIGFPFAQSNYKAANPISQAAAHLHPTTSSIPRLPPRAGGSGVSVFPPPTPNHNQNSQRRPAAAAASTQQRRNLAQLSAIQHPNPAPTIHPSPLYSDPMSIAFGYGGSGLSPTPRRSTLPVVMLSTPRGPAAYTSASGTARLLAPADGGAGGGAGSGGDVDRPVRARTAGLPMEMVAEEGHGSVQGGMPQRPRTVPPGAAAGENATPSSRSAIYDPATGQAILRVKQEYIAHEVLDGSEPPSPRYEDECGGTSNQQHGYEGEDQPEHHPYQQQHGDDDAVMQPRQEYQQEYPGSDQQHYPSDQQQSPSAEQEYHQGYTGDPQQSPSTRQRYEQDYPGDQQQSLSAKPAYHQVFPGGQQQQSDPDLDYGGQQQSFGTQIDYSDYQQQRQDFGGLREPSLANDLDGGSVPQQFSLPRSGKTQQPQQQEVFPAQQVSPGQVQQQQVFSAPTPPPLQQEQQQQQQQQQQTFPARHLSPPALALRRRSERERSQLLRHSPTPAASMSTRPVERCESKPNHLHGPLDQIAHDMEMKEATIAQLQRDKDELSRQAAAVREKNSDLESALTRLCSELANSKKLAEDIKEAKLETVRRAKVNFQNLRNRFDDGEKQVVEMLQSHKTRIETSQKVEEARKERESYKAGIATATAVAKKALRELNDVKSLTQQNIVEKTEDIKHVRLELESSETRRKKESEEKDAEIKRLQSALQTERNNNTNARLTPSDSVKKESSSATSEFLKETLSSLEDTFATALGGNMQKITSSLAAVTESGLLSTNVLEALQTQLSEKSDQLKKAEDRESSLRQELKETRKTLQQYKSALEHADTSHGKVVSRLEMKIESLEADKQATSDDILWLKKDIETLETSNGKLEVKNAELQAANIHLEKDETEAVTAARAETISMKGLYDAERQGLVESKQKYDDSQKVIQALRDTITETTQKEKVAQTQAEERNKVVAKAESELKKQREHTVRLEKEVAKLNPELIHAKSESKRLADELAAAKGSPSKNGVNNLNQRLRDKESNILDLKDHLNDAKEAGAKLQVQLQKQKTSAEQAAVARAAEIKDLGTQKDKLADELSKQRTKVEGLEANLAQVQASLPDKNAAAELSRQCKEAKEECARLQQENEDLERRLRDATTATVAAQRASLERYKRGETTDEDKELISSIELSFKKTMADKDTLIRQLQSNGQTDPPRRPSGPPSSSSLSDLSPLPATGCAKPTSTPSASSLTPAPAPGTTPSAATAAVAPKRKLLELDNDADFLDHEALGSVDLETITSESLRRRASAAAAAAATGTPVQQAQAQQQTQHQQQAQAKTQPLAKKQTQAAATQSKSETTQSKSASKSATPSSTHPIAAATPTPAPKSRSTSSNSKSKAKAPPRLGTGQGRRQSARLSKPLRDPSPAAPTASAGPSNAAAGPGPSTTAASQQHGGKSGASVRFALPPPPVPLGNPTSLGTSSSSRHAETIDEFPASPEASQVAAKRRKVNTYGSGGR